MDTSKHQEYFNGAAFEKTIHIIGCGAVGSTIAEHLARLGIPKIHLWDFDAVTPHNIANQMFYYEQIHLAKVDAVAQILQSINPQIEVVKHSTGWKQGMNLSGFVFLAVDSIKTRKEIVEDNLYNENIIWMQDHRMRMLDAQVYTVQFSNKDKVKNLLKTMDFTDDEAKDATPVSACGTVLNVMTTVRMLAAVAVTNFIEFVLKDKCYNTSLINLDPICIDRF